jgi:hypothetical protein
MIPEKRKSVDLLIEEFWRKGYLTIRRRFGTYLPDPKNIGGFEVDVVARQKKNYAIGITLLPEDFNNPALTDKISYLATRQTRLTSNKVLLFIGVPAEFISAAKEFLNGLTPDILRTVKLIPITERKTVFVRQREAQSLFA